MKNRKFFFLGILLSVFLCNNVFAQQGPRKPFRFRLETKSHSRINTTVEARDYEEARNIVAKRYKDSKILNYYPSKEEKKKKKN